MPTFKHPCPYCGKFIEGSAIACPFCGVTEPFTHGRCPDCRAQLQPGWLACTGCGRTLTSADTISPATIGTTGVAMAAGARPQNSQTALPASGQPEAVAPGPDAGPGAAAPPGPDAGPGAAVGRPVSANSPPSAIAGTGCTGCGARLASGARFCTECGTLVG